MNKHKETIKAYDKNALFYAETFDKYGIRIEDIDRAFKLNKSGSTKVLELGCGNGRDAGYIVSEVGKVEGYIGVDASSELVKIARVNNPGIEFHVKDILDLKFEREVFGLIFAFYSMLHVNREELATLISNCVKWLKIGGILYISSKYGQYKEIEVRNFGDLKYYYSYEPQEVENLCVPEMEVVYRLLHNSDYGPSFTLALKRVR
jgi:SAM-dependent methyltransferase